LRRFVDLCIRPDLRNTKLVREMASLCSEMGFSAVGVLFSPRAGEELVRSVGRIFSDEGLDMASRTHLEVRGRGELLQALRRVRRRFEVVSVGCLTREVARVAARDRRVDLLRFPSNPKERARLWFDRAEANLASSSNTAYELCIDQLLELEVQELSSMLRILSIEVRNAVKAGVPVVASSWASDRYGLRPPRDMASVLVAVGMEVSDALRAVSKNPMELVERNREKLSPSYVMPGVRVVDRL